MANEPDRSIYGLVTYLSYDLQDNCARVDVEGSEPEHCGRGQLYFDPAAHGGPIVSERLDTMIQLAFVHKISIRIWIHSVDEHGRQNVVCTANFLRSGSFDNPPVDHRRRTLRMR